MNREREIERLRLVEEALQRSMHPATRKSIMRLRADILKDLGLKDQWPKLTDTTAVSDDGQSDSPPGGSQQSTL